MISAKEIANEMEMKPKFCEKYLINRKNSMMKILSVIK